jgi:predicted transcriptional regulator
MEPELSKRILLRILFAWDRESPKALAVSRLERDTGVSSIRFSEVITALAERGHVKLVEQSGERHYRVTLTGVDFLYAELLGLRGWRKWPKLAPAIREALAQLIAGHYSGSEIGAFLAQTGLSQAGWQGGRTKWRELSDILDGWQGVVHVLVYLVLLSFVDRANLVQLGDEQRGGLLAQVNRLLSPQGLAVTSDKRIVLVAHEHARRIGVGADVIAAVQAYSWHANELSSIAELLNEYSGCRTRLEARDWLGETASVAQLRPRKGGEGLLDYWCRALEEIVRVHGPAGFLPTLAVLANPRERMVHGDLREILARMNEALEWSPVRVEPDGSFALRLGVGKVAATSEHLSETNLRGEPVSEGALAQFLSRASEDDATTTVIAPLLRMSGFLTVTIKGHRDKSGEYGQDIRQMKLVLPTGHALFFAVQVKAGDINSGARGATSNIETLLTQARMALGKKTWDTATQAAVAVNHVLLVATGTITEGARIYLQENLADANRSVLLLDRDGLIEMVRRFGLPREQASEIAGGLP